jgi:hypothetical protein
MYVLLPLLKICSFSELVALVITIKLIIFSLFIFKKLISFKFNYNYKLIKIIYPVSLYMCSVICACIFGNVCDGREACINAIPDKADVIID